MTPEYFQTFARYNRWMNLKVYAAAGNLTDEERKQDRGAFFKTIHATLNHILVADRIWLGRFTAAKLEAGSIGPGGIRSLDQELYADFQELRAAREQMDAQISDWASALTPEQLAAPLRYGRNECSTWSAVAQLFNHQTHHRGQITTLLTQAGQDVGATDLSAMLREEH
ncbi:MAG TPA: DinB family protein [Polyangiaceae bacterium]|nr:DinB family protein [Polyangiaceae bacterium]